MAHRFIHSAVLLLFMITILLGGAHRPNLPPQEPESNVARPGPGVTLPKLTHKVEPQYSRLALDAGVQGNVLLDLGIDEKGVPYDLSVLSPLGFGLDERALECVSQWRFKPATKDGKPVKFHATVETSFRLLGQSFDAKTEERRTQFNAIAARLSRQKEGRPSEKDVKTMQDLANHKFAAASYVVGLWEIRGDVLPKDVSDGLARIQKAADKNYGPALFFVGSSQVEGTLIPKDLEKGWSLIRDAAVLGSTDAQFTLGKRYANGDGIAVDPDRAKRYFRLCAASGKPECQFYLGQLLLTSQHKEQDWLQAIAWLELAESHHLTAAQSVVEPERAKLTPDQAIWVARLKNQLEHKP